MGGAASTEIPHGEANTGPIKKRHERPIFERASINPAASKDFDKEIGDAMDEYEYELVSKALLTFFFVGDSNGGSKASGSGKIELLTKKMKREKITADSVLMTEGEPGSKLYIVESGDLEVSINGEVVRLMSKGSMVGELALLYDAPRTATIKCKTDCVMWSLTRDIFKHVQSQLGVAVQVERSRGLIQSPELAVLSAIDLSRIINVLEDVRFDANSLLYEEGMSSEKVILIERGSATLYTTVDVSKLNQEEKEKRFCIFSGKRGSVHPEPGSFPIPDAPAGVKGLFACKVGPGSLIGIGALRGKAKVSDGWNNKMEAPFTLVAEDIITGCVLTVEAFENLIGECEAVLPAKSNYRAAIGEKQLPVEIKFDGTKFRMKHVLGTGSFGVVIFAEYREKKDDSPVSYALKCLSKFSVVETGQIRHMLDERKLLASLDSPFVLRLYGTYQTPHQLVMVTELIEAGDLWSILYDTSPFAENHGLSSDLTKFYAASLVLALDHVHTKRIVYRDLKPENIVIDRTGYIRLIDFGFAKKVPFTKIGPDGKEQVFAKTYTLCGTPEYLSPELIFQLGHDQSSDLWALGVLIHEMMMGVTPFAPTRHDNVTELFTNIAMAKKKGLHLDKKDGKGKTLMQKGGPDAHSLLVQLLNPVSEMRVGKQGASTRKILNCEYFKGFDIVNIMAKTYVPTFLPPLSTKADPISGLQPVRSYNGDQKIFAAF